MARIKNLGIMETLKKVKTMNPGRCLRALYEEHMMIKRDRLYLRNIAKAEGWAEGIAEGRVEGIAIGDLRRLRQDILELLEELGEIPEDIHSRILATEATETLGRWLKTAAKTASFDAFREKMI